ncbi:MAG: leucine--tRNA ligase, partial [Thermoprotei archaeon]
MRESRLDFLKSVERKWQERWARERVFEADPDTKPKFLVTLPDPYVSAYPHPGPASSVLRVDIVARYKRMRGFNVLFPQGWHATGGPIVAAALRVRERDPKQISILKSMGIGDEDIPKFENPEYWVKFFTKAWREDFKRYGLSIDWRREFFTTYLNPPYNRFIQWQYTKLRERGLITKGKHPVVWCPKERKVVSDHDRPDEYAGIGPEEVVIIKFRDDEGTVYPCLTYRPETVYGAVNVWVRADAEYRSALVDGERWILSDYMVEELRDQDHEVKVLGKVSGAKLIGRLVTNPVTNEKIPILPAKFVEPELGTGIVMSVPSHAPYDYAALMDLKKDPKKLAKYDVDPSIVSKVSLKSIIKLKGYGEHPAEHIVKAMGIKSQDETEKLDEATKEIYSKEYYNGVLKEVFGKYAGLKVHEAKEGIINDLTSKGIALRHWSLPEEVYCRCGAKTHVKMVKDQWFLRYSDREWKGRAHRCVDRMILLPESLRESFHKQIEWYEDWACTHRGKLGTPLPWDPEWVLESLSDSTIYMAYYTIAKYLQHPEKYGIDWDRIDNSLFDYVFYGIGNLDEISRRTGIKRELIEAMRNEFLYWYPVDLRISGKDLMNNHIIFFILHHVALFPESMWPRGISINGWIMVSGKKMSKTHGNFILLREAIEKWGADATRFAEAYAGDAGLEDPNFEPEVAEKAIDLLYEWYEFAITNYGKGREDRGIMEEWFESVLNTTLKDVERLMEGTNFKSVLNKGFFELQNAFKWYVRRVGTPNKEVLKKFIETQTLILAPFTPHIAEEIWERIGKEGFISVADWPRPDESKIRPELEKAEEVVRRTLEDAREILRIIKGKPRRVTLILASEWKYRASRD